MNVQTIVDRVRARTRHNDDTRVINEVHSASTWAWLKIYNSENGADLLSTFGNEFTMTATTREYDLGAAVTGTLYGVKKLWLKFATDTSFTPMCPADANDRQFMFNDQWLASDTLNFAKGHPVYYDVINFAKVRFAPALPVDSIIRADIWLRPPDFDPTVNPTLDYGSDVPEPAHEAIVDKATAQIFELLDDDRWGDWNSMAEQKLNDAMHLMTRRTQGPPHTQPFRTRRRRWV